MPKNVAIGAVNELKTRPLLENLLAAASVSKYFGIHSSRFSNDLHTKEIQQYLLYDGINVRSDSTLHIV